MTDAELSARMRENIVTFKRLQGAHAALGHLALPGVDAFGLPSQPATLFQQMVLYASADALADALAPLEAFYRGQGIPSWRVFVPVADTRAARLLARAGYFPMEQVPVLGLALDAAGPPPPEPALEAPSTLEALLALNEAVFGEPLSHLHAWRARMPPPLHPLLVCEGGAAQAGGLALDGGDTAGIYLVATSAAARRRGLASHVMRGLLHAARARGRAAAVLQTSPEAHGVYRRVGLRDVDRWTDWVRPAV